MSRDMSGRTFILTSQEISDACCAYICKRDGIFGEVQMESSLRLPPDAEKFDVQCVVKVTKHVTEAPAK